MGPRREQRRDVGLGEQGFHRGQAAAGIGAGHGGLVESRGARVVSRGAGFGTGTVSTPWASAVAPFRLVAPRTRTRYLPPGASGLTVCTTRRSDGTGRCLRSWRTRVVSTRAAAVSRPDGKPGRRGPAGRGGPGGGGPARGGSRRAGGGATARRPESAPARPSPCGGPHCAAATRGGPAPAPAP